MNTTGKVIAWVCTSSVLCLGCYTTSVIDPREAPQERLQSVTITKAVTRDDSTYYFDRADLFLGKSARGAAYSVIGYSHKRRVALPFSNLSAVVCKEFSPVNTALAVAGAAAVVVGFVAAANSMSHIGTIDLWTK